MGSQTCISFVFDDQTNIRTWTQKIDSRFSLSLLFDWFWCFSVALFLSPLHSLPPPLSLSCIYYSLIFFCQFSTFHCNALFDWILSLHATHTQSYTDINTIAMQQYLNAKNHRIGFSSLLFSSTNNNKFVIRTTPIKCIELKRRKRRRHKNAAPMSERLNFDEKIASTEISLTLSPSAQRVSTWSHLIFWFGQQIAASLIKYYFLFFVCLFVFSHLTSVSDWLRWPYSVGNTDLQLCPNVRYVSFYECDSRYVAQKKRTKNCIFQYCRLLKLKRIFNFAIYFSTFNSAMEEAVELRPSAHDVGHSQTELDNPRVSNDRFHSAIWTNVVWCVGMCESIFIYLSSV